MVNNEKYTYHCYIRTRSSTHFSPAYLESEKSSAKYLNMCSEKRFKDWALQQFIFEYYDSI